MPNDLQEIIAQHHEDIAAVQGRAQLATSLAQALTKREWDAKRKPGDFKAGDWVLVHVVAPNRLAPYFTGPFRFNSVTSDKNFVTARHFVSEAESGPYHVSRLLHFDFTCATAREIVGFQLDAGSYIVDNVEGHRVLGDGTYVRVPHTVARPGHHLMDAK